MEKYINFKDHPYFAPMYNPIEMLEMGVFQGTIKIDFNNYSNSKLHKVKSNLIGKVNLEDASNVNKYSNYGVSPMVDWFNWYLDFYLLGRRLESTDKHMIYIWMLAVDITSSLQMSDKPHLQQAMLELAWNYEYKPKFTKNGYKKYSP